MKCRDHLNNEYNTKDEMLHKYDIPYATFQNRMKAGWTLEKALTTPVKTNNYEIESEADYLEVMEDSRKKVDGLTMKHQKNNRIRELEQAINYVHNKGHLRTMKFLSELLDFEKTGDYEHSFSSERTFYILEDSYITLLKNGYSDEASGVLQALIELKNIKGENDAEAFVEYREDAHDMLRLGFPELSKILENAYNNLDKRLFKEEKNSDQFWKQARRDYRQGNMSNLSDKVIKVLENENRLFSKPEE